MKKVFVFVSGEHPTLPKAEIHSILEAENVGFRVLELAPRILRVEVEDDVEKVCGFLGLRSAYLHVCGVEIFSCEALEEKILGEAERVDWDLWVSGGSFAVRVERIGEKKVLPDTLKLERKIGGIILEKKPNLKVNLEKPEKLFFGIASDGKFVFGLVMPNLPTKSFSARTPRKKPFFHPSSLQPKLARCMVNLSRVNRKKTLLDPFCGTGTILIEAGLMGIESIGVELREKMVKGAKLNLNHYGVKNAYLVRADALKLPLTHVKHVATDPPYGRAASTLGFPTKNVFEGFLGCMGDVLARDGKICLASPKNVNVSGLAEAYGFKVKEKHQIYVHKSLTREIVVLEKR